MKRLLYVQFLSVALVAPSLESCGQQPVRLEGVEQGLKEGKLHSKNLLADPVYDDLRENEKFRVLLRAYAPAGKITIVSPDEPGKRVTIKGKVVDQEGRLQSDRLVYFYHTMHNGHYMRNPDDRRRQDEHARLFGFVRTDAGGAFEILTIKPAGYPGEKFPSHIHVVIHDESGKAGFSTEFQFDDDPRLTREMRETSKRYGNLISSNAGTADKPVYIYDIRLP